MNFILRVINEKEKRFQNRMLGESYWIYRRDYYSEKEWVEILKQYYPEIFSKSKDADKEIYALIASSGSHLIYQGYEAYIMTENGKTFEKV